ncbi:hypothetical protein C8R47DRAFT_1084194 [Mycena vitilis]|nr:hypothetical protein C8R47DRAFT_1084194 [Mycena vitilis]
MVKGMGERATRRERGQKQEAAPRDEEILAGGQRTRDKGTREGMARCLQSERARCQEGGGRERREARGTAQGAISGCARKCKWRKLDLREDMRRGEAQGTMRKSSFLYTPWGRQMPDKSCRRRRAHGEADNYIARRMKRLAQWLGSGHHGMSWGTALDGAACGESNAQARATLPRIFRVIVIHSKGFGHERSTACPFSIEIDSTSLAHPEFWHGYFIFLDARATAPSSPNRLLIYRWIKVRNALPTACCLAVVLVWTRSIFLVSYDHHELPFSVRRSYLDSLDLASSFVRPPTPASGYVPPTMVNFWQSDSGVPPAITAYPDSYTSKTDPTSWTVALRIRRQSE